MKKFLMIFVLLFCLAGETAGSSGIAFVANVQGNWDLYLTDDQGQNTIRLTKTPEDEKDPSWSLDHTFIIYSGSDGHLYRIEVGTGKTSVIAKTEEKTPKLSPSVSPDGGDIAYARFRSSFSGDDTELAIYNIVTNKHRYLMNQPGVQMWPSWSPDGKSIVYTTSHCSNDCGKMIQELWITRSNQAWGRQFLLTHSFCQHPKWSPDGRTIAFSSDMNGNFDVWTVTLETLQVQQITTDKSLDINPAWSPDGGKLAFVSMRSGILEIWIMNLYNGEVRPLRPFGNRRVECKDADW